MNEYDRSRFYGPFPDDRQVGYTDYPAYWQIVSDERAGA